MDAPFDVVEAMNGINIISLSPCHDGFEAKNLLGSQHTSKKGMNEKYALLFTAQDPSSWLLRVPKCTLLVCIVYLNQINNTHKECALRHS